LPIKAWSYKPFAGMNFLQLGIKKEYSRSIRALEGKLVGEKKIYFL
jgi:hypothetical protein